MTSVDWLKRPIAHRGLHCSAQGIIENTVSAVRAAMDEDFAIEVDLRPARCGTPMVFHDASLERLTEAEGKVRDRLATELTTLKFTDTFDPMMTLSDLLKLVDSKVPLVLEIKSDWSKQGDFERRIVADLADYKGHVAVMSFDPHSVEAFAHAAPGLARGLVAENFHDSSYWRHLEPRQRFAMRHLLSGIIARPHFIAYNIDDLPASAPLLARHVLGLPLLTWTVRTEQQRARAARYADAPIFEREC